MTWEHGRLGLVAHEHAEVHLREEARRELVRPADGAELEANRRASHGCEQTNVGGPCPQRVDDASKKTDAPVVRGDSIRRG